MKPRERKRLPKEPLSPEDRRILRGLFAKRLRGFFAVGAIVIALILIELGPDTQKIHDAIENPKLRWAIGGFAVALAAAVFYRRVWIYNLDLKAGFKYVDRQLIISKDDPAATGRYLINLEDLDYHRLELRRDIYDRLQVGDRYPVGFAAHSGYALTREAAGL